MTVVGAGVVGLSSALCLARRGWQVRVVADRFSPRTTSDVAGAFWYPMLAGTDPRSLQWALDSYEWFLDLSEVPGTGIECSELVVVQRREEPAPAWSGSVRKYRDARPEDLPAGETNGFVFNTAVLRMDRYLHWLLKECTSAGVTVQKLATPLRSMEELPEPSDLVVHCSGLGAKQLVTDEAVFPIRGQLILTDNPGIHRAVARETPGETPSYVIPSGDRCIIGTTASLEDTSEAFDEISARRMLRRAEALEPRMRDRDLEIVERRTGFRPGRNQIRLESETGAGGQPVIHNYGHGGAGVTLSWGCAKEVTAIAERLAAYRPVRSARTRYDPRPRERRTPGVLPFLFADRTGGVSSDKP